MILIAILAATVAYCKDIDTNTFSNYLDIQITHLHIEWLLDLNDKYINATSEYTFHVIKDTQQINLDVYQLNIYYAYLPSGKMLKHYVKYMNEQSLKQGDQLQITLDRVYKQGETLKLRIKYSVTEKARALGFLTPEQTDSKTHPYLYSYCQDNNCRSMIPLQDTPSIKQTFSAVVLVKDPALKVFLTGNILTQPKFERMGQYDNVALTEYQFELDIKIPSYLLAIVAGNLVERKVGAFSYVICETTCIDKSAKELEFLQDYVNDLAKYIGPYDWGVYKIVIMPPSFPLGGMEHPLLTFASPTIIVGDKSGVGTAIHEIGHSWVGNTVTCNNWSNMWINEGFCTFLERKMLKKYEGEAFFKIESYLGHQSMYDAMLGYGLEHSYSSIHPKTTGENPDDSVSTIPYNKGYQLLLYIETLVGETAFQKFLQDYIVHFKWQSIDEDDLYQYLLQWVTLNIGAGRTAILNEIQAVYKDWVYKPGLPPKATDFHTQEYDDALLLAQAWIDSKGLAVPKDAEIFNTWKYNQKSIFLSQISKDYAKMEQLTYELMDTTYELSISNDSRMKYRWFIGCLKSQYYKQEPLIKAFTGSHGAKGWMIQIYSVLNKNRPETAVQWFKEFRYFYHPSVVDAVENEVFKQVSQ